MGGGGGVYFPSTSPLYLPLPLQRRFGDLGTTCVRQACHQRGKAILQKGYIQYLINTDSLTPISVDLHE